MNIGVLTRESSDPAYNTTFPHKGTPSPSESGAKPNTGSSLTKDFRTPMLAYLLAFRAGPTKSRFQFVNPLKCPTTGDDRCRLHTYFLLLKTQQSLVTNLAPRGVRSLSNFEALFFLFKMAARASKVVQKDTWKGLIYEVN
jgi:hypothetical protein